MCMKRRWIPFLLLAGMLLRAAMPGWSQALRELLVAPEGEAAVEAAWVAFSGSEDAVAVFREVRLP